MLKGTCSSYEMLKGYMLIYRNDEGVHGQRKVGNPCFRPCKLLWGHFKIGHSLLTCFRCGSFLRRHWSFFLY